MRGSKRCDAVFTTGIEEFSTQKNSKKPSVPYCSYCGSNILKPTVPYCSYCGPETKIPRHRRGILLLYEFHAIHPTQWNAFEIVGCLHFVPSY